MDENGRDEVEGERCQDSTCARKDTTPSINCTTIVLNSPSSSRHAILQLYTRMDMLDRG